MFIGSRYCVFRIAYCVSAIRHSLIRSFADSHEHRRATSLLRFNRQRAADQFSPLAHAVETQPVFDRASAEQLLDREAAAVVLHDGVDLAVVPLQQDADMRGAGVFGDVGQRFLDDAIERVSTSGASRSPSSPTICTSTGILKRAL